MSNVYINVEKSSKGFNFNVSGKTIPATAESIQKLIDFTISKLPVKDRKPLAENLLAESTFILESIPDWIEALQNNLDGYKYEKVNKLSWSIKREDQTPLTSENLQAINSALSSFSVESVDDLVEYKKEKVTIGGHDFDVSLPLIVVYRKKQDRAEKKTEKAE